MREPFKAVSKNTQDPEELIRQSEDLLKLADQLRAEAEQEKAEQKQKDHDNNLSILALNRQDLQEVKDLLEFSDKMSDETLTKNVRRKRDIEKDIDKLEQILGLRHELSTDQAAPEPEKPVEKVSKWPTVAKVLALVFGCWGIVSFSGDFILDKYPNAAIYNDVSFQKVLFAFSVFIFAIAAVIAALAVFFPGFSKYFNPFNRYQLDFFEDFQKLDQWQRTIIAVALFATVLFSFVFLVSGKLD